MYNFFVDSEFYKNGEYHICGSDFNHVKNVLRMKIGERVLISCHDKSHLCEITSFTDDSVIVKVLEENALDTSLPISITLFQGLPKADKLELIIQKAVELGTNNVVPVEMKNCVVKIEDKKKESKRERWQSIAESASKQSKRNSITQVSAPTSFANCLKLVKDYDLVLVPYECENGMQSTAFALSQIKKGMNVAVFIGPEGGFDKAEISALKDAGALTLSLGKRILRTETAAITALSMLMLHAEMNI
jgi:16S rRNA (uracil1498-N3)-methyltransferase